MQVSKVRKNVVLTIGTLFLFAVMLTTTFAQSTVFSYQGSLNNTGLPANGNYDFEFKLFDAASGGTQQGTTVTRSTVPVANGIFTVGLDFGFAVFPGAERFLEIGVRQSGTAGITILSPRQPIGPTPYAIRSGSAALADSSANALNAATANNALQLGGVNASQFVQTNDARLSDARNPLPNSTNYVQNRTSEQTSTNFNISGNGTVGGTLTGNVVSGQQFNFGANRVLFKNNANNLFLGTLAGSTGGGNRNTMLGDAAGQDNASGEENTFLGFVAGQRTTTGSFNTFVGSRAGLPNTTNSSNTFLGYFSGGSNGLTNATAVGAKAFVEQNNALVLGSVNGTNTATSDTNVGIGTSAPGATLDIEGALPNAPPNTPNLRLTNFGRFSLVRGRFAGGTRNTPTAALSGNTLLTITADGYKGNGFSDLGMASIFFKAAENWSPTANGTAIEFGTTPNGSTIEAVRMRINDDGNVGIGVTSPVRKLDVDGIIRVGSTTGTIGCIEDRDGTVIAGTCASDLRFKKNVTPFDSVLGNFSRLRPVNYFWRADEFIDKHFGTKQSYGLIAQEVEELFPELVTTDEKGYKAVNYSKIPLLTVQAVREQQAQIDQQLKLIEEQRKQNSDLREEVVDLSAKIKELNTQSETLKRALCSLHPQLAVCAPSN